MRELFILAFFFIIISCQGQNKQLLYNVSWLPQTLMSNPGANITFDRHFGVPFLSQVHVSAGSTTANLHDIFEDSDADINERVTATIRRLTNKDHFMVNEQLEIVSLGWRLNKEHYLSMGVYQEMDMFAYFPKDPAVLVNEGNNDYINLPFDFSDLAFTGEILTVYHLGLNKKINPWLTVGARGKLYSGIFNVESTNNSGVFITRDTPEGPNYYRHFAENIDIRVNTSGYASLKGDGQSVQESTKDLLKRSFFGGNFGAGIDLGATYAYRENLIFTASVQDIGIMLQRSDVENYTYRGSYQTDGIEPLFPDVDENGKTIPYWDIFEDEVDKNLKDKTLNESYVTWRPRKINASVEYGYGKIFSPCDYRRPDNRRHKSRVGLQMFGIHRPKTFNMAMSVYYDSKVTKTLRLKVAYTVDDYSFTNLGFLISKNFKNFNAYLAADNIFGYLNLAKSQSASIQLGMQFIVTK
ncbi:DUF5723 family protein [Gillisia sp. M10.2A]|uniref:DUF5723 family protein n=1 Tax=Gillisia lutea TaxID=2909668 RepID=A0ABS9EK65_9FLAO|nr:DUF5723 family protein [Gillisia lutea]MCF4102254.1 DUF5723 family protein [Gillisia lutea]